MTEIPNCPNCGKHGLPIVYGNPSPETIEWHNNGWVAIGGDFDGDCMAGFRCECQGETTDFGDLMPEADLGVWIGIKWFEKLLKNKNRVEAIEMLRKNPGLTIKECLKNIR
jgi:hypothetical protein